MKDDAGASGSSPPGGGSHDEGGGGNESNDSLGVNRSARVAASSSVQDAMLLINSLLLSPIINLRRSLKK